MRNNRGYIKMIALCFLLCISAIANAQTRYWVGGSGNWMDLQHWSAVSGGKGGASLPSASSDVVVDDNSGLSKGGSIILAGNIEVGSLLWNGASSAGFSGNYTVTVNDILNLNSSNGWAGTIDLTSTERSIATFASGSQNYSVNFLQSSNYKLGSSLITSGKVDASKAKDLVLGDYTIEANPYKKKKGSLLKGWMNGNDISVDTTIVDVKCYGTSTGSIRINAVKGTTGAVSYMWKDSENKVITGETSNTLQNRASGTYYLIVRDELKKSEIFQIPIESASPFSYWEVTPSDAKCTGAASGSIAVSFVGGTSPYYYSIDNGVNYTTEASPDLNPVISNLSKDTYNVVIKDANGCALPYGTPVNVGEAVDYSISTSLTHVTGCSGNSNGVIDVNVNTAEPLDNFECSIDGENFATNSSFQHLRAGSYTITVRRVADHSCTKTTTVSLTEPEPLSATVTSSPVSGCSTTPDGKIIITSPKGGSGEYEYSVDGGVNWSNVLVFKGLTAGEYTVMLRDKNATTCSIVLDPALVVGEEPALIAAVSHTDATCKGSNTGSVTLTNPQGGSGAYEYSVVLQGSADNWTASLTYENLSAGIYVVKIRDKNKITCEKQLSLETIVEPNDFSATVTSTNANCFEGNGSITITNVVGGGNYEYSIDGGATWGTASTFTVPEGNYPVWMRIAGNAACSKLLQNARIEAPAKMTLAYTVKSDVKCNGESNGSIELSLPTGGTAPYSYSIAKGDAEIWKTAINDASFSALSAGNYTIKIKDSKGCIQTITTVANIKEPAVLTAKITPSDISCFGETSGSLAISAPAGGTAPYQYQLLQGGAVIVDWQTPLTFVSLPAGTYSVNMKDANGCEKALGNYEVKQGSPMTATVDVKNLTCFGDLSGEINISNPLPAGGNYQFSIDNVNWQTGTSFKNLEAKEYPVYIKDMSVTPNCVKKLGDYKVEQPATNLSIDNIAPTSPLCNGGNSGKIVVTATGGTLPLTYSIGGTFQSSATFDGLDADLYTVTVKDAKGCVKLSDIELINPDKIVTDIDKTEIVCGATTGSVNIKSVTNGTAPYQYSISGATGTFSNLATIPSQISVGAGTYNIVVKDANGCLSDPSTHTIAATVPLQATIASHTDALCFGQSNGSISLTITSGTAPYKYNIGAGEVALTGTTITGLPAGTYNVTLKDASTCSIDLGTVQILQPATALTATATGSFSGCAGNLGGEIEIVAQGGTGAYSYSVDNGVSYKGINPVAGLAEGPYTGIIVKDANGCTATANSVTIVVPDPVVVNDIPAPAPNCSGDLVNLTISAGGGVAPLTYAIDNDVYQTNATFENVLAGSHTLKAKDANGCVATKPIEIISPAALVVNATGIDVACNGQNSGKIRVTPTGGTAPYAVTLNPTATFVSGEFANLSAGSYDVTVTDSNGCVQTQAGVEIKEPTQIVVGTPTKKDPTCLTGGSISVTATGGTMPLTYKLMIGTETVATQIGSGDFDNVAKGTYKVAVTDANRCPEISSSSVNVKSSSTISFSNLATTTNLCNGDANGSLSATISGIIGAPTITLKKDGVDVAFNSTPNGSKFDISATGLSKGTYTLSAVGDGDPGCAQSQNFVISEPNELEFTTPVVTPPGVGDNGSISIPVVNNAGTAPYTYKLMPTGTENTTGIFDHLAAGTYTVTVTDANNCFAVSSTLSLSDLSANLASTDIMCKGDATGSIAVDILGGTTPYTIKVTGNGGLVNELTTGDLHYDILNLAAGDYSVLITDANGSSVGKTATIGEPAFGLTLGLANATPGLCANTATGVIELAINGGTNPYTIVWAGDNSGNPSTVGTLLGQTISDLTADHYEITVTDVNGCSAQVEHTIVANGEVSITVDPISPACGTTATGSITITATGGDGNYTYSMDGVTFTASNKFENLTDGNYQVLASDGAGCTSATQDVTLTPSSQINIVSADKIDAQCAQGGQITVVVAGGNGDLKYELIKTGAGLKATNDNGVFNDLEVGEYKVRVSDLGGTCPPATTDLLPINNSGKTTALAYQNIETNPGKCFGEKSSVKFDLLNVEGNINVLVINKDSDATLVQGTDYNIDIQPGEDASTFIVSGSDFIAGNYKMYVSDDNACPVLVQFGFNVIATPLSFDSITKTDPVSSTSANGTITAVATGGMPPYMYTLMLNNADGSTTTVSENNDGLFTGLNPGTYVVTVEDAYHCVVLSTEQVLEALSNIVIEDVYVTNPKCNNGADGRLEVITTGTTGAVSYSMDGGTTFQDSPIFENVSAGEYKIVVKDEVGAVSEKVVTVNNPTPVVLDIVKITTPSKDGKTKGSIQVIASGGTGFYNYVLTNETTGVAVTNVMGGTIDVKFNSLPIGQYTVKATDENGCEAVIGPIDFQELSLDLTATDASCVNNDATLNVVIKGGLAPYTLTLTDPEGNAVGEPVNLVEKNYTFENLQGYTDIAKKYTVTVVDATNSTESQTIHIDSPNGIELNIEETSNKLCFGNTDGFIKLNVTGGNPDPVNGYTVTWTNGDAVGTYDNVSSTITGLPAGNYIIAVTDANGCKSPEQNVAIEEHSDLTYAIDKGDATCGDGGSSANGFIEISGLEEDVTLSLTKEGDDTTLDPLEGNPNRFENLEVGNYSLIVKRDGECPAEKTETIRVESTVKFNFEFVVDPDAKKLCYGTADGEIVVNITGGATPYQRVVLYRDGIADPIKTSEASDEPENEDVWKQTFGGLTAGSYQVLVVDANGCTQTGTTTLEQFDEIVVVKDDAASNLNMWCKTDPSDVKISVSALGGVAPYVFSISNEEVAAIEGDHAEFTEMPFGPFTVSVLDSEGCSVDATYNVSANTAILDKDSTNAACRYFTDPANAKLYGGSVTIKGVNGDFGDGAIYSFSPLADGLSLEHGEETVELKVGTYYGVIPNDKITGLIGGDSKIILSVQDEALTKTCIVDTIVVSPGVTPINDFKISAYPKDTVVCSNKDINFGLVIDKLASTATTYFVSWDGGNSVVVPADAFENKMPIDVTGVSFMDKLTSQNPSVDHSVKVTIDGIPSVGKDPIPALCYDVDTASAKAYPSNMEFYTMPSSVPIRMVEEDGYFIRIPRGVETGVGLSFNSEIEDPEISWSPEDAEWFNPIPFVNENNDTLYTSAIQINDKFLSQETIRAVLKYNLKYETCSDSLGLILMPLSSINPPNAITPNGDGFNDVWRVVYGEEITDYPMLEVEIFNRWGTKIYSSKPYKNNWDGRKNGKDLPTGTYYYVIKPHRGNLPNITGSVSIIR